MSDNDYQFSHVARNKSTTKKRSGKTPEAKASAAIDKYLASLPCLSLRTSAGLIEVDGRKIQMGQAGVSDRTVLIAGLWLAIEIKAEGGKLSPAQEAYRSRVEALGGTYVVARSVEELRAGLCRAYGPQRVEAWEAAGRERKAAKKAEIDGLKRKMGQL